jgi:2-methylisocitrate lyase-like PEP mutase family enzyme
MSVSPPDRLRALLAKPGFVVMPAVWDGLSAKLSAAAGFETAFLSGSCVAASRLGGPDLDLISFAEMLDSFNMVRGAASQTLVLADGDHGFGNPVNVQRTVRAFGRAGAAAILIEDKISPRALTSSGKPCLPREEARMKIRAAVDAAKDSGILVLARTDCRPTQGIDEAAARIEMYVKEGADILFLDSPADEVEIKRGIDAASGRPSFVVLSPGDAVAEASCRARLQDRHLSHRHALAVGRRHECGARRAAGGRRGSGEHRSTTRVAQDPGLPRLRRPGEAVCCRAALIRSSSGLPSRLPPFQRGDQSHLLRRMSPFMAHIPRSWRCTSSAAIGGSSAVRSPSPDR